MRVRCPERQVFQNAQSGTSKGAGSPVAKPCCAVGSVAVRACAAGACARGAGAWVREVSEEVLPGEWENTGPKVVQQAEPGTQGVGR